MKRKKFIQTLGAAAAGTLLMNNLQSLAQTAGGWPDAKPPAPALFIGHGAPLNALGLQAEGDEVHYPIDGIAYGSTSMRSVVFSGAKAQALR